MTSLIKAEHLGRMHFRVGFGTDVEDAESNGSFNHVEGIKLEDDTLTLTLRENTNGDAILTIQDLVSGSESVLIWDIMGYAGEVVLRREFFDLELCAGGDLECSYLSSERLNPTYKFAVADVDGNWFRPEVAIGEKL